MLDKKSIQKINSELKKGISLLKCKKCGCMKDVLETFQSSFVSIQEEDFSELMQNVKFWLKEIKPTEYSCLGCKHCYPAVAMNIFNQTFPKVSGVHLSTCNSEVRTEQWPPVPGEYFAFCEGVICPVAVSTLASVTLAEDLAKIKSKGLCIVGKTETENIGIDKIIKNTITNPTIRFLLLVGRDSKGHESGKILLSLWKNGVDKNMRVIGSSGKLPVLKNVTPKEIDVFRKQIEVINMIGCEDTNKILNKIEELSKRAISICEAPRLYSRGIFTCFGETRRSSIRLRQRTFVFGFGGLPATHSSTPLQAWLSAKAGKKQDFKEKALIQSFAPQKILTQEAKKNKLDRAGYFVVIPSSQDKTIIVEHYAYDNKLLHTIQGKEATAIYSTIIASAWLTELSHAAYLGKELAKAELSLKYGFKYTQDKAF